MELLPVARLLPFTVRDALDPATETVPNVVLPSEKLTLPVGTVLPLAAFTVATS